MAINLLTGDLLFTNFVAMETTSFGEREEGTTKVFGRLETRKKI